MTQQFPTDKDFTDLLEIGRKIIGRPVAPAGSQHWAIVVPPDVTAEYRVIKWPYQQDGATLAVLHREIGCDCVDASPRMQTPHGQFEFWCDDVGLLAEDYQHNDRMIVLARVVGYPVRDIAGTVVLTGGTDPAGHTLGLSPEVFAWLTVALEQITDRFAKHTAAKTATPAYEGEGGSSGCGDDSELVDPAEWSERP